MKRIFLDILVVLIVSSFLCLAVYRFYKIFPTLLDRWGLLALLCCAILFVSYLVLEKIATKMKWIWLLEFLCESYLDVAMIDRKRVHFPEAYSFLKKQHKILRRLARSEITSIIIAFDDGMDAVIEEPELIANFKKSLSGHLIPLSPQETIMKYVDNIRQLKLEMHTVEDTFTCNGYVIPKRPDHIILSPAEGNDYGGISLRGLKLWFDENVFGIGTSR